MYIICSAVNDCNGLTTALSIFSMILIIMNTLTTVALFKSAEFVVQRLFIWFWTLIILAPLSIFASLFFGFSSAVVLYNCFFTLSGYVLCFILISLGNITKTGPHSRWILQKMPTYFACCFVIIVLGIILTLLDGLRTEEYDPNKAVWLDGYRSFTPAEPVALIHRIIPQVLLTASIVWILFSSIGAKVSFLPSESISLAAQCMAVIFVASNLTGCFRVGFQPVEGFDAFVLFIELVGMACHIIPLLGFGYQFREALLGMFDSVKNIFARKDDTKDVKSGDAEKSLLNGPETGKDVIPIDINNSHANLTASESVV